MTMACRTPRKSGYVDAKGFPDSAGKALLGRTTKGYQANERILDDAIKLFATEGYAGLSIRKVAARSKISLSNVQYYFPTKSDLVHEIVSQFLTEKYSIFDVHGNIKYATLRKRQFEEMLYSWIDRVHQVDHRALNLQVHALAQVDRRTREVLAESRDNILNRLDFFIGELNPAHSPQERRVQAQLIFTQIEGMTLYSPLCREGCEHGRKLDSVCVDQIVRRVMQPSRLK